MDTTSFGEYLKDLRKKRGLTLVQLADLAGCSNPYLSRLERGKKGPPSFDVILRLAMALNSPLSEMLAKAGYKDNELDKRAMRLTNDIELEDGQAVYVVHGNYSKDECRRIDEVISAMFPGKMCRSEWKVVERSESDQHE